MTTDPTTDTADFDGCNSECRRAGAHTLRWGGCELAPEPEPTVSLSRVYTDTDGHKSIGFDSYTVPALAELIEPALRTITIHLGPNARALLERGQTVSLSAGEYASLALAAADAIVHRNDEAASVPVSSTVPAPTTPVCLCGHPMHQHHEDVCLTECGCQDGREPETALDLPGRLQAALTARFTESGNPGSAMRRHEQGPDGWPASHPVGPRVVAEVLGELLGRAEGDGPRLPDHMVNEEEAPTTLRDRVAEALREHGMVHLGDQVPADEYDCCADAVLAVLPAPVDRATDEADVDTVAARASQVITTMGADIRALTSQRDRYRAAWRSARERAQAFGEGILLHVAQRDFWQKAAEQNYKLYAAAAEELRRLAGGTADGTEARAVTVDELAHALDNSTPYPIELDMQVARFMAERLLEMTAVSKRPEHDVWQPDEETPGEQPEPLDPTAVAVEPAAGAGQDGAEADRG